MKNKAIGGHIQTESELKKKKDKWLVCVKKNWKFLLHRLWRCGSPQTVLPKDIHANSWKLRNDLIFL